ncbi:hypothetical protein JL100_035365 (plasmid) [Skermanella mucosa]|uniref:hypothetical protein n=1 Tax=Skermanella mucosa TaxID=1789672 RepID=UPI00192C8067|nr:hypothetical protein [Skermanella mucosa]UEM25336.1 hypothetical protein JL100_035365 [Skermanella mucosa]
MTDDRKAAPGSKQRNTEPAEVRKPAIIAGSGRGGLSGGADPGSTGAGIAGGDVDVAGIGGKATRPARDSGR